MTRYSIEPRTENNLKDIDFYHLQESTKKQILDEGLDASIKAGEFIGNKVADAVIKPNYDNMEPVEEIIIPLEKREKILNKLR